jgi:6,7-dimethyl-8-ribityllumazine synthase
VEGQEPSGHVIPLGVGLADRHVKTIRHPHCGTVTPGDSHKASHEEHKKNPKQPASHEGKILHPPTSEPQATRAAGIFLKIHLKVAGTQKIENIAPMSKSFPPRLRPAGHSTASYAIVASKFNQEFVQALVDNAHAELSSLEPGANIVLVWTPGSFEIPLFVQATAELNRFQAVIALGVILEGETEHARLIAEAVTRSLMDLSLKHKLPVIHEVLLVKDEAQARARCMGTEHNRGVEAARAAVSAARKLPEIV